MNEHKYSLESANFVLALVLKKIDLKTEGVFRKGEDENIVEDLKKIYKQINWDSLKATLSSDKKEEAYVRLEKYFDECLKEGAATLEQTIDEANLFKDEYLLARETLYKRSTTPVIAGTMEWGAFLKHILMNTKAFDSRSAKIEKIHKNIARKLLKQNTIDSVNNAWINFIDELVHENADLTASVFHNYLYLGCLTQQQAAVNLMQAYSVAAMFGGILADMLELDNKNINAKDKTKALYKHIKEVMTLFFSSPNKIFTVPFSRKLYENLPDDNEKKLILFIKSHLDSIELLSERFDKLCELVIEVPKYFNIPNPPQMKKSKSESKLIKDKTKYKEKAIELIKTKDDKEKEKMPDVTKPKEEKEKENEKEQAHPDVALAHLLQEIQQFKEHHTEPVKKATEPTLSPRKTSLVHDIVKRVHNMHTSEPLGLLLYLFSEIFYLIQEEVSVTEQQVMLKLTFSGKLEGMIPIAESVSPRSAGNKDILEKREKIRNYYAMELLHHVVYQQPTPRAAIEEIKLIFQEIHFANAAFDKIESYKDEIKKLLEETQKYPKIVINNPNSKVKECKNAANKIIRKLNKYIATLSDEEGVATVLDIFNKVSVGIANHWLPKDLRFSFYSIQQSKSNTTSPTTSPRLEDSTQKDVQAKHLPKSTSKIDLESLVQRLNEQQDKIQRLEHQIQALAIKEKMLTDDLSKSTQIRPRSMTIFSRNQVSVNESALELSAYPRLEGNKRKQQQELNFPSLLEENENAPSQEQDEQLKIKQHKQNKDDSDYKVSKRIHKEGENDSTDLNTSPLEKISRVKRFVKN